MKLILCTACNDVVSLRPASRTCYCGRSRGNYLDPFNAEISGPCVPIEFMNETFRIAVDGRPMTGKGRRFTAVVLPKVCPTVKETKPYGQEQAARK